LTQANIFSALGPNVIFELRKQHQKERIDLKDRTLVTVMTLQKTACQWAQLGCVGFFQHFARKIKERRLDRDPGDILPP
jgi:hypothetical protein